MDNFDSLQSLLEILVLVMTLSSQSPLLGIAAAIAAIVYLLSTNRAEKDENRKN
jgi:hypothetical protein